MRSETRAKAIDSLIRRHLLRRAEDSIRRELDMFWRMYVKDEVAKSHNFNNFSPPDNWKV